MHHAEFQFEASWEPGSFSAHRSSELMEIAVCFCIIGTPRKHASHVVTCLLLGLVVWWLATEPYHPQLLWLGSELRDPLAPTRRSFFVLFSCPLTTVCGKGLSRQTWSRQAADRAHKHFASGYGDHLSLLGCPGAVGSWTSSLLTRY